MVSYNLLLEAIGRSNSKDVVTRCAQVLRDMRVPPNDYTLAVMMKLWSSRLPAAKAMEEADRLFRRIKTPSLASYCHLISGWSRLDPKHAASYVDEMLRNWKSLSLNDGCKRCMISFVTKGSVCERMLSTRVFRRGIRCELHALAPHPSQGLHILT